MKMRKLMDSFNNAIEGLFYAVRTQRNMRIHIAIALCTLAAAIFAGVTREEALLLFMTISFVIAAEMLNTAIEAIVDKVSPEYHPLAAVAKNVAAGAVLISALNAVVVGYLVFYEKIRQISLFTLERIKVIPIHGTVISLIFVLFIVLFIKALGGRGSLLRGGMPSGHSALGASLFVSISLLSGDALIAALAAGMVLLVFHSRAEAGVHTLYEIVIGAVLGTLVTFLLFQLFWL